MRSPFDRVFLDIEREMVEEMDRVAHAALRHFDRNARTPAWQPRVDVCETPDAVHVAVELAGLDEESLAQQVEITLAADGHTLRLRGRREERCELESRTRCHQLEIFYGPFERVIPLPTDSRFERENISARYRAGLLEITLPKRPSEEPRMIAVNG